VETLSKEEIDKFRSSISVRFNFETYNLDDKETTMQFDSEKKELKIHWQKMTEVIFADYEEEEGEEGAQSSQQKYKDFPFDENGIYLNFEFPSINVGEIMESKKVIRFEITDGELRMLKTCDLLPEWNIAINKTRWEINKRFLEGIRSDVLEYRFHLYREPNYILLSTAGPLFLINISTLTALAFPPSDYANKLAVIVTLMLALFAFMPSLRSFIPKVSYLTAIEYQLYMILGIMLLILVEAVTTYLLTEESSASIIIKWVILGISIFATGVQVLYFFGWWTKTKIRNDGYLSPCGCLMKKEGQDKYKFGTWRKCELDYEGHKKEGGRERGEWRKQQ